MSGPDQNNVEAYRKAREELMRSLDRGDVLIQGIRLDTLIGYAEEIRRRGQHTVERQIEDLKERETLKNRVRELEAMLAGTRHG